MRLVPRVPEHAMHDQVQVVAHNLVERLLEPREQRVRLVEHGLAVGCQVVAALYVNGFSGHAPKRQVEEAELQHELNAAFLDDVLTELGRPIPTFFSLI